ncbi:MAG: WYL domain-containing protein [Corynebacterium sp.]|nr:WYL domain-containing protein [Corynebacterium sp.]
MTNTKPRFVQERRLLELAYTFITAFRNDRKSPWITLDELRKIDSFARGNDGELLDDDSFRKRLNNDLKALDRVGIPVIVEVDPSPDNTNGRRKRYKIDAKNYPLTLRFTEEEATLLGIAYEHAQELKDTSFSASAWAKIASTGADRFGANMGVDDYALVRASLRSQSDIANMRNINDLYTLSQAIAEKKRVSFIYEPAGATEGVQRIFDIYGFSIDGPKLYVVGWDYSRRAERVFRISNIHSVKLLKSDTEHREHTPNTIAELVHNTLPANSDRVDVRIKGMTGELRRYKYEDLGDNTYVLKDVPRASIVRDLLFCCDDVVVEEPKDLRDAIIARLKEVAKNG